MTDKKHACADCSFCQWCTDDRCRLCRGRDAGCGRKRAGGARKQAIVRRKAKG